MTGHTDGSSTSNGFPAGYVSRGGASGGIEPNGSAARRGVGGRACVLVVDDDRDLREATAHLLRLEGYATIEAENGREALHLLRRVPPAQRPGLVLLDLMMPDMDGWGLVSAMADDRDLSAMPVVIMTASFSSERKPPGGYPLLEKPLRSEALLRAVARGLGGAEGAAV